MDICRFKQKHVRRLAGSKGFSTRDSHLVCFAKLKKYADMVEEVKTELREKKGIEVDSEHVLVTSGEKRRINRKSVSDFAASNIIIMCFCKSAVCDDISCIKPAAIEKMRTIGKILYGGELEPCWFLANYDPDREPEHDSSGDEKMSPDPSAKPKPLN